MPFTFAMLPYAAAAAAYCQPHIFDQLSRALPPLIFRRGVAYADIAATLLPRHYYTLCRHMPLRVTPADITLSLLR